MTLAPVRNAVSYVQGFHCQCGFCILFQSFFNSDRHGPLLDAVSFSARLNVVAIKGAQDDRYPVDGCEALLFLQGKSNFLYRGNGDAWLHFNKII